LLGIAGGALLDGIDRGEPVMEENRRRARAVANRGSKRRMLEDAGARCKIRMTAPLACFGDNRSLVPV
jgi:hypothetical protein